MGSSSQAADKKNKATEAELLQLTSMIAAAYARGNSLVATELPALIQSIHESLGRLNDQGPRALDKPAVPIEKSVTNHYLVCLEDGRKLKMLKRYLRATYQMTPEDYRAKWGLPPNYPMVAPSYAKERSAFARRMGLGSVVRKGRSTAAGTSGAL